MPQYVPIAASTHASKRWQRYSNYAFAAPDAVVPLVAHEMPKACMTLPLAFVQQGEQFAPVALLGLHSGQNLYVAADGRWLGAYIPSAYRGYPFALAQTPEGQQVLCIDADSGLVHDSEGEAFFDEHGQPSQPVKDVLNFLQQVHANRAVTQRVCTALSQLELLQPWPITLQSDQGEQALQGLWRIDEAKLKLLDAAALHRLQQTGALPLAYCQLLSMQHLPELGKRAQALAQASAPKPGPAPLPTTASGELDLEFLNDGGTLRFGFM